MEKLSDYDENRRLTLRREKEIDKSMEKIVEIIVNRVQNMPKKYWETVDSSQVEEVSRRLSMLTRPFVAESLEKMTQILRNLKINVSNATLVHTTLSLMQSTVILIPDIGPTKCALVRKRTAEFVSQAINYIKNGRVKGLKSNRNRKEIAELTREQRSATFAMVNKFSEVFENNDEGSDSSYKSRSSVYVRKTEMNVLYKLFQLSKGE